MVNRAWWRRYASSVRREGATRIAFRCSPYYQNSALYPVIDHLQRFLQWQRDDTPEAKLDTLEQVLRTYRLPLEDVVPLFAALLSVPLPERYPPLNLTPQRQRQKTQEALVAWLLEEAERQPVLAVWEDLHWADPSTLELLGLVLDQAPTARMLTLLTFRPEFRPPWAPQAPVTQVTLNRLGQTQIETMITHLTGGKPCRPRWCSRSWRRPTGYPVCRRTGQDDPGIRAGAGGSRPLCADRAAASLGDSLDTARFTDGPARPASRPETWRSSAPSWGGSLPTNCSRPSRHWMRRRCSRAWRS